jgi:hypothetical protein
LPAQQPRPGAGDREGVEVRLGRREGVGLVLESGDGDAGDGAGSRIKDGT